MKKCPFCGHDLKAEKICPQCKAAVEKKEEPKGKSKKEE